jgi:uncharacterized protein
MDTTVTTYLIVLPFIFLAGFIDSIAGGGGLISVPAYLAGGLPPHLALGNNKFSSAFGTLFSTARYFKHGMIDVPVAGCSAVFALGGSYLGTRTVLFIEPMFLNYVLLILIPLITIFTLTKKTLGEKSNAVSKPLIARLSLGSIAGLLLGFYDGFFGPGTGTFLILFYTTLLKYDFVEANGNTKVVNLSSNVASLVTFFIFGKILFAIAVPAAAFGIAGNLVGSKLVVKKGVKIVRPVFVAALLLLFMKIVYDLFLKNMFS